jgi:hypothetical protein
MKLRGAKPFRHRVRTPQQVMPNSMSGSNEAIDEEEFLVEVPDIIPACVIGSVLVEPSEAIVWPRSKQGQRPQTLVTTMIGIDREAIVNATHAAACFDGCGGVLLVPTVVILMRGAHERHG